MKDAQLQFLLGEKGNQLCQHIFSLQRRLPRLFPTNLIKELKNFLLSCSDFFLEHHSVYNLARILFSHYRLAKETHDQLNQKIHVKILEIDSSVYGIVIALFSLSEEEFFGERQIIKGIQNLIPGIKPIPDSFLTYTNQQIHYFYLEIKQVRGGLFSKETLSAKLPSELSQRIECLSQSLFLPGNEEETFKNIRHLSQEIRSTNDHPQVMITFVEYFHQTLKFLVIILRIVKPTTPSIQSLSLQLPPMIQFSLESTLYVDKLDQRYPKEAAVFTLEVNSSLFMRHHSAVNLRAARQYIVKALESMIGAFRDYNGGLLHKENEQFLAIKRELEKKGIFFPLLEDVFYSIKPIAMRVLISTPTGIELTKLFQQMETQQLDPDQKYCLAWHQTKETHLALIKTREKEWKTSFLQRILAYSSQLGSSCIEHEGYLYLCFFHQYPNTPILLDAIQKELNQNQLYLPKKQSILRINFQGGDPPSLNPRLAMDIHCHTLCNLLFEGLTRINQSGEIEPAVAEKIEISTCRTQYTFYLRPSWWSNGEEVTAYHFERAWKKSIMAGWISPDFFAPIKNAKKVREKKLPLDRVGIIVKDAKTLCVELENPCPYFLNLIAAPQFYPLFGEAEEPFDFNGPFTLAEWLPDQSIYLSQNPFYWDSNSLKLEGIKIFMERDPYAAYKMFQRGELDLIGDPSSPLPPQILKSHGIQRDLTYKPISRVFWIHCNTHSTPLHNENLRRAMSLAINREKLVEKTFIHQIPHCSPFPPKYAQFQGEVGGNLELAHHHLELAVQELKTLPPIEMIHSDFSFDLPLIEEVKAQWKEKLGITIIPKKLSWNEFSSALEKGQFQLGGLFRRDLFNNVFFYASIFEKSPLNSHSWENKEYQSLLERFYREEKQEEILREIETLLIEKAPVIPLVSQRYLTLIHRRIKGVDWNENGCPEFKEVTIDDTDDQPMDCSHDDILCRMSEEAKI